MQLRRILERSKTSSRVDDNEQSFRNRLSTDIEAGREVLRAVLQEKIKVAMVDTSGSVEDSWILVKDALVGMEKKEIEAGKEDGEVEGERT